MKKKFREDPTVRKKISEASKRYSNSEEGRAARRKAVAKLWADPKFKEKMKRSNTGRKMTPEQRARHSASCKEAQNRPEQKAKIAEANRRRWAKWRAERDNTNSGD